MAPQPPQPILLVGFTVRMLAELAVRAGYRVLALDYFGDADLRALCESISLLRDYGGTAYSATALVNVADTLTAPSVVYTAGLENHPGEVARLARGRQLLGNMPETLRHVRNPLLLMDTLRARGFAFPQTFTSQQEVPRAGRRWLWKPLRSGGGHEVRPWGGAWPSKEGVVQERVPGMVGSAIFVADGRQAVLLGLTEQLVGVQDFGATGFRYCGNVLPPRLPSDELVDLLGQAQEIVAHLTATFGLRGLNGVDFVWHEGRVWTIEVNPRPTAAMELVDHAYNLRVFDAHVRSFAGQLPSFNVERVMAEAPAAGKAILYAPEDLILGDTSDWHAQGLRDIPHPGERILKGHPVCTILVLGDTPAACLHQLKGRAAEVRAVISEQQSSC